MFPILLEKVLNWDVQQKTDAKNKGLPTTDNSLMAPQLKLHSDRRLVAPMCRCYQTIPGVAKAATAPPAMAGQKKHEGGSQKVW